MPPIAKIISVKNTRAWISMNSYLNNWKKNMKKKLWELLEPLGWICCVILQATPKWLPQFVFHIFIIIFLKLFKYETIFDIYYHFWYRWLVWYDIGRYFVSTYCKIICSIKLKHAKKFKWTFGPEAPSTSEAQWAPGKWKISVLCWPFLISFSKKIFFCLIPMKISHKLCVRLDGTRFLWLWWFTAKTDPH